MYFSLASIFRLSIIFLIISCQEAELAKITKTSTDTDKEDEQKKILQPNSNSSSEDNSATEEDVASPYASEDEGADVEGDQNSVQNENYSENENPESIIPELPAVISYPDQAPENNLGNNYSDENSENSAQENQSNNQGSYPAPSNEVANPIPDNNNPVPPAPVISYEPPLTGITLNNDPPVILPKSETETFMMLSNFSTAKGVDLVFIIDNSGSMKDNQQKLSTAINSMVDALVLKNPIDLMTVAVSTDDWLCGKPGACGVPYGIINPQDFSLDPLSSKAKLKNMLTPIKGEFPLMTGIGSAIEEGFDSLLKLFKNNKSIFRSEVPTHVIVLSDENDQSNTFFINKANSYLQEYLKLKSPSIVPFVFHSIVNDKPTNKDVEQMGTHYIELSQLTKGQVSPIGDPDFTQILSVITENINQTLGMFTLKNTPYISPDHTLMVQIGSTVLMENIDYSFDPSNKTITILNPAVNLIFGFPKLEVKYFVL